MKNVTDNGKVPHDLSEEELQRLAEYFSILREWSLQRSNLSDRDEGTSAQGDNICRRDESGLRNDRKAPSVTGNHAADE